MGYFNQRKDWPECLRKTREQWPTRKRVAVIAELRKLGWTVFCDEEEDDVQ